MVVKGRKRVLEHRYFKEALQEDLDHPAAAVQDHDQAQDQEAEGMAGFHRQHRKEKAQHAGSGVAHQHGRGIGIEPEVGQHNGAQDHGVPPVIPQGIAEQHREGHQDHRALAGTQTVHAVGAVGHIDRKPDQRRAQSAVHPGIQREGAVEKGGLGGIETDVGHHEARRKAQVDQALFVVAPGFL